MDNKNQPLIIGICGRVLAIDPATGMEIWRAKLKGTDTVTISTFGGKIFAGTSGELFCLDASDGRLIWRNKLKGLGIDIVAFGSPYEGSSIAAMASKRRSTETTAVVS